MAQWHLGWGALLLCSLVMLEIVVEHLVWRWKQFQVANESTQSSRPARRYARPVELSERVS